MAFWSRRSEQSEQLTQQLARLTEEYRGRFVLAKVEGETNPMLLQQFAVQGVPAVFAVVAGQALPLFQGVAPEEQVRATLDQLIQVGEERFGLTGIQVADGPVAETPAPVGPYDALLDAAMDALNANDFAGAVQAYKNVLADDPANPDAKAGLVQAELLARVTKLDPQQTRKDAADRPADPAAQIAAAELDLAGGHVEDAFSRLVDTVRVTAGDDRDAARVRLLELFEVVGADDPRVSAARTALARVLF
ncbi:co-chaperone YbbN [Streptomyces candidus]|nr:co-chaperone YbbN [Streptomyces candidus]